MGGPATVLGKAVPATDNFLVRKFVLNGKEWMSCEQYFQAMKFASEEYREKIRGCDADPGTHGMAVWRMGQNRNYDLRADWELVKVDVMYEANAAKFAQHADLRAELLATDGPIRAAPSTDNWQKWNSEILERIRHDLREKQHAESPDPAV
mmetsp:Transcript_18263/g.42562  ORF Transcript_18263/g.42562 Transcript_18263/m.42562 type:complete len:151 (+) Transcript_18263:55-507(+)